MTTSTYVVTGRQPVLGHRTGEEFTVDLKPEHEARLVAAGHIRLVTQSRFTPRTPARKTAASSTDTTTAEE